MLIMEWHNRFDLQSLVSPDWVLKLNDKFASCFWYSAGWSGVDLKEKQVVDQQNTVPKSMRMYISVNWEL